MGYVRLAEAANGPIPRGMDPELPTRSPVQAGRLLDAADLGSRKPEVRGRCRIGSGGAAYVVPEASNVIE